MVYRVASFVPMLAAVAADAAGAHRLAFYLLLLAVPAAAIAALDRFAAALDGNAELRQAIMSGAALVLVVLTEATRGPHLPANAAPALAVSTLAVALVLAGMQVLTGIVSLPAPAARRPV